MNIMSETLHRLLLLVESTCSSLNDNEVAGNDEDTGAAMLQQGLDYVHRKRTGEAALTVLATKMLLYQYRQHEA